LLIVYQVKFKSLDFGWILAEIVLASVLLMETAYAVIFIFPIGDAVVYELIRWLLSQLSNSHFLFIVVEKLFIIVLLVDHDLQTGLLNHHFLDRAARQVLH